MIIIRDIEGLDSLVGFGSEFCWYGDLRANCAEFYPVDRDYESYRPEDGLLLTYVLDVVERLGASRPLPPSAYLYDYHS